jgi:hypothetical protein
MEYETKSKKEYMKQLEKSYKKKKTPQINRFLDEECQIILEDKKRAYNKVMNRNTRQNVQEYKGERKRST